MTAEVAVSDYDYGPGLIPIPDSEAQGMWRWRGLLPFDGSDVYPTPVGATPLVPSATLGSAIGLDVVYLKDEARGPTGSNKDRATALCVADAVRQGAPAIACASTGNVAVSLSAGGAAVGLPVFVFVAAGLVSPEKERYMRAVGATVVEVDGSYADAYHLSDEMCQRLGWYNRNTGTNPLALQAKKTVAFEIWEQLGRRVPDVVYVPVGDGVTLAAAHTGFSELVACGVADRLPRLVGVQAIGSAPLADAFLSGSPWQPVEPQTIADGIAVGEPTFADQALAAVRETGGTFVTVEDVEIEDTVDMLARYTGMLVEPAGAAATAALVKTASDLDDEVVVSLVTGTGLKDHRWWPEGVGRKLEVAVEADRFPVEAAEDIISGSPTQ